MSRKKLIIVAAIVLVVGAAVAVAFFILKGRGGGEEDNTITPPLEYRIGGVDVVALPVQGEGITVYLEKPEPQEPDSEDGAGEPEEAPSQETADAVTYRYEGLADSKALIAAYTMLMDTKDTGFTVVDQNLVRTDAPDFEAEEGTVRIARRGAEEGKVMSILMTWTQGSCTVTTDTPEGEISDPPEPEAMTVSEVADYVHTLSPSTFGLAGDSMQSYNVYVIDGTVLVDGVACIRLNVYRDDGEAETNEVAGNYFLSADRRHIYRLDVETGEVMEMG